MRLDVLTWIKADLCAKRLDTALARSNWILATRSMTNRDGAELLGKSRSGSDWQAGSPTSGRDSDWETQR